MNLSKVAVCRVLLPFALLATQAAHAQSAAGCPVLGADSGLQWNMLDGSGLVFCKALRVADGNEVFSVTISDASPFAPQRSDREGTAIIDGHDVRWYRSEIASKPDMQVRETLVQLDDGRVAHISLRAASAADLASALAQAEAIRFDVKQPNSK